MQKWFINCIISTTNKLIWQFHQRRPNAPFSNKHDSVYCMPFITQLASKHSTLSRAVSQYLHGILQKHTHCHPHTIPHAARGTFGLGITGFTDLEMDQTRTSQVCSTTADGKPFIS